jgi:hypothetical protein
VPGIATTQTVCADTTLSILRAARRVVWALAAISALGNVVGGVAEGREGCDQRGRVADRVFHGVSKEPDVSRVQEVKGASQG